MVNTYNEANFEVGVISSDKPVLVDFWSDSCPPCRVIAPLIDELAEVMEGKADVGKVDVSSNQGLAVKYRIRAIPCLLFFKNGELKEMITGSNVTLDKLQSTLEELI